MPDPLVAASFFLKNKFSFCGEMRNIICSLLFFLVIFLNYVELWAMDPHLYVMLPRPRANRFGRYPAETRFLKDGKVAGYIEPKFGNFVIDYDGYTPEPLIQPTRAHLPQGAFVYREGALLGILKNEEIFGKYTNDWDVIFKPRNGDKVKDNQGRTLSIWNDGWEPVSDHPAGR